MAKRRRTGTPKGAGSKKRGASRLMRSRTFVRKPRGTSAPKFRGFLIRRRPRAD